MELKLTRIQTMLAVAVLAVLSWLLRLRQVSVAFDEAGMVTGKGIVLPVLFAVAAVACFGVYSFRLADRKKYAAIAGQSLPAMALCCAAALLLVCGSVVQLLRPVRSGDLPVAVVGLLAALCWVAVALIRFRGARPHAALFLIPIVFYVADLVCCFRFWTRDPVILDYAYDLLAMICLMCASLQLGGFAFDQGQRRMTVGFSLCGVFFCAAALVGAEPAQLLGYLAGMLWLLGNLWLLLRPAKQG